MATRPISNAECKRLARARALVELQRSQKAEEGSITAFRAEELYWKDRTREPDWSLAFQADSDSIRWESSIHRNGSGSVQPGSWTDRNGDISAVQKWNLANGKTACCFLDNPGELTILYRFGIQSQDRRLHVFAA